MPSTSTLRYVNVLMENPFALATGLCKHLGDSKDHYAERNRTAGDVNQPNPSKFDNSLFEFRPIGLSRLCLLIPARLLHPLFVPFRGLRMGTRVLTDALNFDLARQPDQFGDFANFFFERQTSEIASE